MNNEKPPPSVEITQLFCTLCGSYIRNDELCSVKCEQDNVFLYDRPKGTVKNAVYRLTETRDTP